MSRRTAFTLKGRARQPNRRLQPADHRRRLRWAILHAAARFHKLHPQWTPYFFDMHFLLNRGLPIIQRHTARATSNSAIDLALAWAEEWPSMNASQRKACLQAQTVIAAELLRLVTQTAWLPRLVAEGAVQEQDGHWGGMGALLAYVQAHNPPARDGTQPRLERAEPQ